MSEAAGNNRPIIIKRKKVVGGDGHHGGAWKVAYADFVTAMMAFFMLMWLLNATSEQQRAGLADYFTPTITINRSSGGGEGMFGGDSVSSEDVLTKMGEGSSMQHEGSQVNAANEPDEAAKEGGEDPAQVQALENLEVELMARGGESIHSDIALRHITTELTDEGLVIEFYDLPNASLFVPGTDEPMPVAYDIADLLAEYVPDVTNPIAVRGHVRAEPIVVRESTVWELSTSRASKIRELLELGGYDPMNIVQTAGEADRDPAISDLTNVRNNRIEVIVLRTDR